MAHRDVTSAIVILRDRPETHLALRELLLAREYSRDASRHAWDFAVEAATLRELGLSDSDLRWLVSKSIVEHRREITDGGQRSREFQDAHPLKFDQQSCFVITAEGQSLVEKAIGRRDDDFGIFSLEADDPPEDAIPLPNWDGARRQLRVCDQLIKHYRWPAPNQEKILATFQEDGWVRRIDDPLAPVDGMDPKQRLHDTVKCLNRNQLVKMIQFRGDGSGEGVTWQFTRHACQKLNLDLPPDDSQQKLA